MALQLGRRLRERYIVRHRLLPPQYGVPASGRRFPASASTPLLAETTASQRTVLTLQGVFSGLYPAGTVAKGVAVPVACRKAAREIMVGGNATCPVLLLLTAPMQALQDEQVSRDPQLRRRAARVHSGATTAGRDTCELGPAAGDTGLHGC
ncbi:hypothetical protein OEZ85_000182 [Tetradesmus obliquus]|uniref:Uncharacterized protein n=1 Tax=Tetradesmus obliquus TaxID=3088 RepID=A0ABY8UQ94_TETOB|nr:hypothetical protein OEZ85_000182 [Tetradesmus obliquus]